MRFAIAASLTPFGLRDRELSRKSARMCRFPLVVGAVAALGVGTVRADHFTFDLNTNGRVHFPNWIPERPVASAKEHAELAFPVQPGSNDEDLALTVVFQEELGSYLSVWWQDRDGKRQLLCANLFEGINLPNQRTLLINRPVMGGPGKVVLQSSQRVLNVLRVRLDWARPGVVRLVDGIANGALVATGGKFYSPEEVDGTPLTPVADAWEGATLLTSVTDRAERIEDGVAFPVTVPARVRRARVEVLVNGLPLDGTLLLWVNGRLAGNIMPEVPDLNDPGYAANGTFVGWRKATLFLGPSTLNKGDNTFQFGGSVAGALAVRDFLLQVVYDPD